MKELSIEEKAKAYDEALERCRKLYNEAKANEYNQDLEDYETIFPELRESEDERIRKEIIKFIKKRDRSGCDYDYDKWIAWLEKQDEKKPTWSDEDETLLYEIVDYFNMDNALRHTENEIISWLKSLKTRLS